MVGFGLLIVLQAFAWIRSGLASEGDNAADE